MKLYKTLRKGLKSDADGSQWKLGKWRKHRGKLEMCRKGFHASKLIIDAMGYVPAEVIAEVEVKGKSEKEDDKQVWSKMRIVKGWNWTKKDSVALPIYAAELVIKNFEKEFPKDKRPRQAIQAAKRWLKNPTKKNQSAAWSAARSAAQSAARSATWSAESAAWSAQSAAWSAAQSAARSATWSAESAAWSARSAARSAESAARSAAWSAARSAARSAAWSAAQSAAWSATYDKKFQETKLKIENWIKKRLEKLKPIE